MTARFQGLVDPATGCVRMIIQSTQERPADAVDFRGMIISPAGDVYAIVDTGQPRVFQDGIAMEPDTGLTLVSSSPASNISMGGLAVDANGAVVLNSPPDVIHQGVGLTNPGELCAGEVPFAIVSAEIGEEIPTQIRVCYNKPPSVGTCGTADTVFTNDSRAEVYPLQAYNSADANCLIWTTAFDAGVERTIDETSPTDVVTLDYIPGTCAADGDAGDTLPSYTDYPVKNSIYGPISAEIGFLGSNVVTVTFPSDLASTGATWNVYINDVLAGITDTSIVSGVLQLTLNTTATASDVVTYTQTAITLTATPPRSVDGRYCWAFSKEPVTNQVPETMPILHGYGADENGFIRGLVAGQGAFNLPRASIGTMVDFEGRTRYARANELRVGDARRVETLWPTPDDSDSPTTQTFPVIVGASYQMQIGAASTSGATAVCSGAFTGTLTADGTNIIGFPTSKLATTTSLTVTITGNIRFIQPEEVSGQTNQSPSEYLRNSTDYGLGSGGAGAAQFAYQNGNTIDGSGIVTLAAGAALDDWSIWLEPGAQNRVPDSEDFSLWNVLQVNVTTDQVESPDGRVTADLIENTASGSCAVYTPTLSVVPGDLSLSVYAKKGTTDWISLRTIGFDTNVERFFNIATGTIGSGTTQGATIEARPDGWYRCEIIENTVSDVTGSLYVYLAEGDGDRTISASSGVTVYLWGADVELTSLASSYYPTSGGAGTRAAEIGDNSFQVSGNFVDATGMIVFDQNFYYSKSQLNGRGSQGIVGVQSNFNSLLSSNADTGLLPQSYDGTSTIAKALSWAADNFYRTGLYWESGSDFGVSYKDITGSGAWQIWSAAAFDGSWEPGPSITTGFSINYPMKVKNLYIYDVNEGPTWFEENF